MSNEEVGSTSVADDWGNRRRLSSRIQEELEAADSAEDDKLSRYHVVKVNGDADLVGIMDVVIPYYQHVATALSEEGYARKVKIWTNPLPPYTRLNGEDPQVFWVGLPAMTDGLNECLVSGDWCAEPFNYEKYAGRLYFCSDRSCGDSRESIMCPTCMREDEDRALELPSEEGGWGFSHMGSPR